MTTLYVDALELDRTDSFQEMRDWLHATIPHQYSVNYLADISVWKFEFYNDNAALLFKLTWGGK